MMVARVLTTVDVSKRQTCAEAGTRLVVREMDLSARCDTGPPREADDKVGASKGDMVLCSLHGGRLSAVGIIDTIQLVGARVYQRGTEQHTLTHDNMKAMTRQEETGYGEAGAGHGGNQRLGGCC